MISDSSSRPTSSTLEGQANLLVDLVIDSAYRDLQDKGYISSGDEEPSKDFYKELFSKREDYQCENIEWPEAKDFTIELGIEKIDEFIKTWEYREESWLYCVDFIRVEDHKYDSRYRYQVSWSIPTRRKPIPRATACVYFTIEVSKVKPTEFPVQVYYVFETNSLVHRPGHSRFRELWLKNIIENKVVLLSNIQV